MQDYLIWTILGFVLIIVEMVTGTFYLLVLGVGAFAGALAAWLGAPFLLQVAVAGLVSVIGTWVVFKWHAKQHKPDDPGNALDVGQAVTLSRWVNQADGALKVKYRGSEWDARIKPGDLAAAGLGEGAFLYILAQDGATLVVGSQRPGA
jgi:membrane protein implicated in regulation of membrane protease activity